MKKRTALILLVVFAMVFSLFAGCADTGDSNQTTDVPSAAVTEAASNTPSGDVNDGTDETEKDPLAISLPLTEEEVTFSIWTDFIPPMFAYMAGMEDNSVYIEMAKRTNVNLDFTNVAMDSALEKLNILVNSGDYPDIWYAFTYYYANGVDTAIEEDIIYNLADYKELLPNYFSKLESNESWYKNTVTDSGNVGLGYGLLVNTSIQTGLVIRQDWLDELGLETPETYDEFTEVLRAFKSQLGVTSATWITQYGDDQSRSFSGGFGVSAYDSSSTAFTYWLSDNGTAKFSPIEDGYLEYLTLMNQWYEEGLLYNDFMTSQKTSTVDNDLMALDQVGLVSAPISGIHEFYNLCADIEGFELSPVSYPVKNAGDAFQLGAEQAGVAPKGYSLTTSVSENDERFEILFSWLDYWYTDEGSFLGNYGVEGESHEIVGGKPVYTEVVTNNPDGLSFTFALNKYCMYFSSFVQDQSRMDYNMTDAQKACVVYWDSDESVTTDMMYPEYSSMTAEETSEYARIYSDIRTHAIENTLKFITGARSLEEFDDFVAEIESLNLQRCIEIKQAALDRYIAR